MRERLRRYLELAERHPDWFANPPNAAFTILLDEEEIGLAEEEQRLRLAARGLPPEWATVGIVYEDQYLMLLRDAVRYLDGARGTYIRAAADLIAPGGVAVLPVYDGQILLIRHFRHATRDWRLEIPSGLCEPGSTSDDDARRELAEEIGGVSRRLLSLGYFHDDIGLSGGVMELFYAEIERYGAVEAIEGITEIVPVTPHEFEMLIRDGQMTTGASIAAFTYARAHGLLPG
jgi:ADP-ribose pyrophosphatase